MRGETAKEQLERWEFKAQRVYEKARQPSLLDARFQVALCFCGKRMGVFGERLCEHCWTTTTHCVEMRLTEQSAFLFALRHVA